MDLLTSFKKKHKRSSALSEASTSSSILTIDAYDENNIIMELKQDDHQISTTTTTLESEKIIKSIMKRFKNALRPTNINGKKIDNTICANNASNVIVSPPPPPNSLPPELILQILENVKGSRDLAACSAVNRQWSACASEKLWNKVMPTSLRSLHRLYRTMSEELIKLEQDAKKNANSNSAISQGGAKKFNIKILAWPQNRHKKVVVKDAWDKAKSSNSPRPSQPRMRRNIIDKNMNTIDSQILQIHTLDMSQLSVRPKKAVRSNSLSLLPEPRWLKSRPSRRPPTDTITTTQAEPSRIKFAPQLLLGNIAHSLRDSIAKLPSPPPPSLATTTSKLLAKLPSCTSLILPVCTITRPNLLLKTAQNLTHLDLSRAIFKSHVALIDTMVVNCTALESLTLSSVMCADQRVQASHWEALGTSLSGLKEVRIESRKPFLHLHGSELPTFFELCNNLERVIIRRLCCLEFRTIVRAIGGSNPKLRRLHLDFKFSVGATPDLIFLADHCSSLRSLHLAPAGSFTDEGVTHLVRKCTHLRQLSLSGAVHITDTSIDALSTYCHGLRRLDLTRCTSLTPAALLHLCKLPYLHTLSLVHTFAALTPAQELLSHIKTLIVSCGHVRSLSLTLNSNRIYPAHIASGEGSRSCGCKMYGGGAHIVAKGSREVRQLLDLWILEDTDISEILGLSSNGITNLGGRLRRSNDNDGILHISINDNADAIAPLPNSNRPIRPDAVIADDNLVSEHDFIGSPLGIKNGKYSSKMSTTNPVDTKPAIEEGIGENSGKGQVSSDAVPSLSSDMVLVVASLGGIVGYTRKTSTVDSGEGIESKNNGGNEYGDMEKNNRVSVCSSIVTRDNE